MKLPTQFRDVIERVAVQARLAQSNFLMRNCSLLRGREPALVNRNTTVKYSAGGSNGTQVVSVAAARIILTRGPLHPRLPINHVG